jgi:hypothetical protein
MEKKPKTIEERVEELLNEDPKARHERTQRLLAERIAYYEAKAEEEREGRERQTEG